MHRLPYRRVPAKGERNIAQPATRFTSWHCFFDLTNRLNKLHRIVVVLLNTRGHRQNIRVKNNILRRQARFLRQELISSSANGYLSLCICRLPLLIKSHDNDRRTIPANFSCLLQKYFLTLLKADRVHDRFALNTLQPSLNYRPLRAVQNKGNARDFWLTSDEMEEARHACLPVQKSLVEI